MLPLKTPIKGVIFDMDGTLVDTESTCMRVIERVFKNWGHAIEPVDARIIVGRRFDESFDFLSKKYQINVPDQEAKNVLFAEYEAALAQSLVIAPGVVDAIKSLAMAFPLTIVSGSRRSEIELVLGRMGVRTFFSKIYGAEDYPRGKPAPDGFLRAIEEMGFEPNEVLIFEDSAAGVASAKAAGSVVINIRWTETADGHTEDPHLEIIDFNEITAEWIKSLERPNSPRQTIR